MLSNLWWREHPNIADYFSNDLEIIHKNLTDETLLVNNHYDFYKILEADTDIKVAEQIEGPVKNLAILNNPDNKPEGYVMTRIITSPREDNSDIIYLYTVTVNQGE